MPERNNNPMMSVKQAAEYMGIAVHTLYQWRCDGRPLPRATRLGRRDYYRLNDLNEFLDSMRATDEGPLASSQL